MCTVIKRNAQARSSLAKSGYTLMELAVVMIIIGVLIMPLMAAYNSYMKKKAFEVTQDNINMVTTSIGAFRALNGRYPCPASLTATRDMADYGRETDCTVTSQPIGSCSGGICIKESARVLPSGPIRIRVGALPFRQLNLSEKYAYDGYGNRLTYALTESLGDEDSFKIDGGGIGIIDTQTPPESLLGGGAGDNSAHFALISHGLNGAGAYLENGQLANNCDPSVMEGQNCDPSETTAVYRQGDYSLANNEHYYDDSVAYFVRGEISPWLVNESNPADIYLKDLSIEAGMGIGTDDTENEKGMVASIVRARDSVKTTSLCGPDETYCTQASVIAGDPDAATGGMKCPSGKYMVAIENNAPVCEDEVFEVCEDGKIITGIDSHGRIDCDYPPYIPPPPVACETENKQICPSETSTLLEGPHGTIRVITAGASKQATYRCDDGTWKQTSSSGECVCNEETRSRNLSCGAGFSGSIHQTMDFICPQGYWTSWTTTPGGDTCKCVGTAVQNRTLACPPEHTGSIVQQNVFTCTSDTSGSWSGWVTIPGGDTCSCEDKTESRTLKCSGGLVGEYTQERKFTCATGKWSGWTETSSSCECPQYAPETRTQSCPAGHTGSIYQTRTFQCPAATWSSWKETSRDCQCTDKTESRTKSCTGGQTGTYTEERTFSCAASKWTSWKETSNNCKCTARDPETRKQPCPSGYTGNIYETRTFECPGGTWSSWKETSRDCKPIPVPECFLEPTGSGLDETSRRGKPVGEKCTCGSAPQPCHQVVGGGLYYNYNSCSCK